MKKSNEELENLDLENEEELDEENEYFEEDEDVKKEREDKNMLIDLSEKLNEHYAKYGRTEILTTAENKICNQNYPSLICLFAELVDDVDIKKLQNAIIKSQDGQYIFKFAKDVKGADIKILQDALIATSSINYKYVYKFAKEIKGADIKALENSLLGVNIKNPHVAEYLYKFAKNVKGANITKLQNELVIHTDKINRIKYYSSEDEHNHIAWENDDDFVHSRPNNAIEMNIDDAFLSKYIYLFAKNIEGADTQLLQNSLSNINHREVLCFTSLCEPDKYTPNYKYLYLFAKDVECENLDSIKKAFCSFAANNHNAIQYFYLFAKDTKGLTTEDILKIQKGLYSRGNFNDLFQFAKDIKGADVLEIQDQAMNIATRNDYYDFLHWYNYEAVSKKFITFLNEIPGASFEIACKYIASDYQHIATKMSSFLYDCAQNLNNADIQSLEDMLCSFANKHTYIDHDKKIYLYTDVVENIINFGKNIQGANIEQLEDIVIKDSRFIISFAKQVPGANIIKLQSALMTSDDINLDAVLDFAIIVPNADMKMVIEYVNNNLGNIDLDKLLKFARMVPQDGMKILEKYTNNGYLVIHNYDIDNICRFLKLNPEYMDIVQDIIIKSNNSDAIYMFLRLIDQKVDINKIKNAIIKSHNAENIYYCALLIFNKSGSFEDIKDLRKALLKIKDAEYFYAYLRNISNKDEEIIKALLDTKNEKFINRYKHDLRGSHYFIDKITNNTKINDKSTPSVEDIDKYDKEVDNMNCLINKL